MVRGATAEPARVSENPCRPFVIRLLGDDPADSRAAVGQAQPRCSVAVWRGSVGAGRAAPACRAVRPGLLELLPATREDDRPDPEEPGQDEHDGGERVYEP